MKLEEITLKDKCTLKYIDCHSHPHDKKFLEMGIDVDEMMKKLKDDGGATIAIGTDYTETKNAIEFAKKYDNCFATIGIHPADNHGEVFDRNIFLEFLKLGEGKVVGIGECGLDYYYFDKLYLTLPLLAKERSIEQEKVRQKELFTKQIEFALEYDLPLVLHGRPTKNTMDAYRDMLDILEFYLTQPTNAKERSSALRGHAHFFVGNLEIAKRFLLLGFLVSFDGPITFTEEYDEVIKFYPIEKIMIETDSPYAAPKSYRGQINKPIYVKDVAEKIAQLKNLTVDEVLEITKNNAIELFLKKFF